MTDTPIMPEGVTWRVTGQQESQQAGANGTYTPGVVVSFTLSTGDAGTVFIPRSSYTTANVKAAVMARAAQLAEVSALEG